MKTLIIILSIILFIFLLFLIPFKIKIIYNNNAFVTVKWLIFKFKILPQQKKNNKSKKQKNKKKRKEKNKENYITKVKKEKGTLGAINLITELIISILRAISNIFGKTKISYSFILTYGQNDAAQTGILYGVISAAVYSGVAIINNLFNVKKQTVEINSDFDNECLECFFTADISFKLITVLKNACIVLIKFLKNKNKDG